MSLNQLLLLSGNDIPFEEAQLVIHQPKIFEVGFYGEKAFWHGAKILNFSKDLLSEEDKSNLSSKTDFEVLMSIIGSKDVSSQIQKTQAQMVMDLLFPTYHVQFTPTSIVLQQEDNKSNLFHIDSDTFEVFKQIIVAVLCLDQLFGGNNGEQYKPANEAAKKLVEKFKQRKKKLAQAKGGDNEGNGLNILSTYASILAVGNHKDLNQIKQYTIFQLFDEFTRYKLKLEFDANIQARMAGAKDLKEAENWMKTLCYLPSDEP